MYYQETGTISVLFKAIIILTVIIGIVSGIFVGNAFANPTEKAIEAMENIAENSYMSSIYMEDATETEWGVESVIGMLSTWIFTFIACVLIYEKKCRIEMLDDIARKLNNIENKAHLVE